MVIDFNYSSLTSGTNATLYGAAHRASELSKNLNPSLICQNQNDKFTVNSKNGNGALTYPVGLITLDEIVFAGCTSSKSSPNDNYLDSSIYWTLTPVVMNSYNMALIGFYVMGGFSSNPQDLVRNENGVRPVVSLINNTLVTGSGTSTNPYVVK